MDLIPSPLKLFDGYFNLILNPVADNVQGEDGFFERENLRR